MYFRVQKPVYINIYISSVDQQTNKLFNISENGIDIDKDSSFTKKNPSHQNVVNHKNCETEFYKKVTEKTLKYTLHQIGNH